MCTINLTFSDAIISKALPTLKSNQEIRDWMQQVIENALIKEVDMINAEKKNQKKYDMSFFDCFDNGAWDKETRSANEIAQELHDSRVNERPSVEF